MIAADAETIIKMLF